MVQGYCCQFDILIGKYMAIVAAIKNLFYFFQKCDQANADYHKEFMDTLEVIEEYQVAGSLTHFPNLWRRAQERGRGGDPHCHCGFNGGGCRLLSPSSTSSSPTLMRTTMTTAKPTTTTRMTRVRSQGGEEMTNEWDFEEVGRRRRATEDDLTAWEDGGGDGVPAKMLFCIVVGVSLHTQELNIKTTHLLESLTL